MGSEGSRRTAVPSKSEWMKMSRNPVLDLPLSQVMRFEIALTLQHVMNVYTVNNLLIAWRSPKNQRSIEQIFDTPQQARHAVAICAAWLGIETPASASIVPAWWPRDNQAMGADFGG
jgi:hypothetical protein